jgi:ABC-type multidrug transport system ATPase subunit
MDTNGFPIVDLRKLPTTPAIDVPVAELPDQPVKHANFFAPSLSSFSTASFSSIASSCAFWFEHDYPVRAPYEMYANATSRVDTTFKPDPAGGWLGPTQLLVPVVLAQAQTFPWAVVLDAVGVDTGTRTRQPATITLATNSSTGTGLLAQVDTNYFATVTKTNTSVLPGLPPFKVSSFQPVPFYQKLSPTTATASDVDDALTEYIRTASNRLAEVNKTALLNNNQDAQSRLQFFADVADITVDMPWGGLLFDQVDATLRKWVYTMQIGSDRRIRRASNYPSENLRKLAQQTQLSNAFLRTTSSGRGGRISHGLRGMPQYLTSRPDIPVGSFIGRVLYPFGISFLLPVFVIMLVREKEDRILVMMKMNGLKARAYYLTRFVHFFTMYLVAAFFFVLAGVVFGLNLFVKTQPGVYIILLLIWGVVQIAMAFLFAALFSKSRVALLVVFLIVLASVMLNIAIEVIARDTIGAAYFIWPPFAFYRSLTVLNTASLQFARRAYTFSDLKPGDPVLSAMVFMVVEIVIVVLLAAYFYEVLPSEYGVRKPWHFPVSSWLNKKEITRSTHLDKQVNSAILEEEDDDVLAERKRVLDSQYPPDAPLVMKRMNKAYGGKVAVKDVTLAVESDVVFGLLGPNGAGKTTLISILTGLYEPTEGWAALNGFNIHTEMDKIYKTMGICPQHDIHWADLTVLEHLLFYARLKGATPAQEMEIANKAIQQVELVGYEDRLAKGLSGGERRRLSIAIALICDPGVVFLDEPTTGLDPEAKRIIWNIVQQAKAGRTIILTTHSMEEAEVLCQRIGIMAKGTLRCIGTTLRLKQQYGSGFRLSFACKPDKLDQAAQFVQSLLPVGWRKIESYLTSMVYEFKPPDNKVSHIFQEMESHKHDYGIDDWGLSQTSLEEVFLRIIQEADAQAD